MDVDRFLAALLTVFTAGPFDSMARVLIELPVRLFDSSKGRNPEVATPGFSNRTALEDLR
jgi:hypothetical protein